MKIICGYPLLSREWLPYHKIFRTLGYDEISILVDCWHFAIGNEITEIKSVMKCIHHFLLLWFRDFSYPKNPELFSRIVVKTVHGIIGQNVEDEIRIGGEFKQCEILEYQMKILQYPIHEFLAYLDRRIEIDYEEEIEEIERTYKLQIDEDLPFYLRYSILDNYKNELEKMICGNDNELVILTELMQN